MKRSFLKPTGLAFFIAFTFSNCASILSRSTYPVYITSKPKGANIIITDKKGHEVYKGKSPTSLTLKAGAGYFSKAKYTVKISAPGYEDSVLPIKFKIDGWYWGNLLIGGWLGMLIVDPTTGAMWKITNSAINETLVKRSNPGTSTPTLQIVDIADIPEGSRGLLTQIK